MRRGRKLTAGLLSVCLILGSLAGCAGAKKQGTPLAVLGEETIFLEEAVFYTRMLQENWEYMYYAYYGEEMWQQKLDEETGTLGEALKRDVLDALTEIHLLCAHAEEYGTELTAEEEKAVTERAKAFMKGNTPEVLEAAGATEDLVKDFLMRNELAARVAEAAKASYEPELDEAAARVGQLTYALFATTGIFDAEGNQTPFTEEELAQVQKDAEAFAVRARELGSVSEAGEEVHHTVIDVYFNEVTDGGAHELVAETARQLEVGGVSELVETGEGYYIVQRVSEYDEDATLENRELQKEQLRSEYLEQLVESWLMETPLEVDEALWKTVEVEEMLTDPAEIG